MNGIGQLLSAIVTLLALLMYMGYSLNVGRMRAKHKIIAPATSGHPQFDRAYRVQMNTLEQLILFLPLLWLASVYFTAQPWLPAAAGLVWIVGRLIYAKSYLQDPKRRGPGFGLCALMQLVLLVLAAIGVGTAFAG